MINEMSATARHTHWESIYQTTGEREVSWFEESPAVSLDLIHATGVTSNAAIIDIGGGASRLVDALLDEGFSAITVLDLSERALAVARARLGERSATVKWIAADVTTWQPLETYDVWHDRAALHFLTEDEDRAAYVERLAQAVHPQGHVIIGTFALDGPARCSGLPVIRYDAAALAAILGPSFDLVERRSYAHQTPMGAIQRFQFCRFRRLV
jgi:trans-aconitate methyltransferase